MTPPVKKLSTVVFIDKPLSKFKLYPEATIFLVCDNKGNFCFFILKLF